MPVFSIKEARNFKKLKQYGPAVANYMSVLKYYPEKSTVLEREFFDCFKHFCADLESNGKVEEANEYFLLLAETFKQSRRFFCEWGDFMLRHGLHEEAALCFMKTLSIVDGDGGREFFQQAELALTDLRDQLVDQWHFRMLNDFDRNKSYENAVGKVLLRYNNPSVLDLGCGTGILSMIALTAGSNLVYACEHSPIMAYIAKKVLSVNEMNEKIILFDKTSSSLSVPDVIPIKVNVLVTELMDAGFFGECIVDSILDAKKRLMSPDGTIIPQKVEIYVILVECGQLRKENFVDATSDGIVKIKTPFVSALASKRAENLSEPYESKMMNKVKNNFRYLSKPILIYSACLNDVKTLEDLKNGINFNFNAEIVADGRLDGVVSWFQVELTEGVTISTNPETKTSWEQAIFPIISPESLKIGDAIEFDVEIRDSWFRITKVVNERFAETRIVQDSNILAVLNDDITANSYRLFMESCRKHFENCRPLNVTDVTGDPTVPFLVVKSFKSNVKVIADGELSAVIRYLIEDNDEKMTSKIEIFSSKASDDLSKPDKIEVLLCQPIDWTTGLIKQNGLEDILYYKLKYGPDVVIPSRMDVWATIVESRELLQYSRVTDDINTLGYRIKDSINVFDVEIHREIEFSTLQYKILTEKRRIFSLNFNEDVDLSNEQIPNLLRQCAQREFCVVDDGDCHALIFWYVLNCDECDLSINTSDSMTRFKVAASILKKTLNVRKNETIVVNASLERSSLKFFVNKKEL